MSKKHLKFPLSLEDMIIIGIEEPLNLEDKEIKRIENDINNQGVPAKVLTNEIKKRIKSAINGLLEDIKLECKPYDMLYGEVGSRKLSFEEIKDLIKKWFGEVD